MGERTRVIVAVMLTLAAIGAVGLTGCTREKPAPTSQPDWVPPTATAVVTTPGPTVGATVISVEETPSGPEPAPTSPPEASPTPLPSTPSAPVVLPTPAPSTPVPAEPTFTYVVGPGNTLFSIARRYDTTVEVLVDLNSLASADDIQVGQELRIPGTAPTPIPTEPPVTTVHVVQRGETLHTIALRYGVTVADIMAANGITNPDRIYIGQRLTIPGGTAPPAPVPDIHVVQAGERLLDIALRYGVGLRALQTANGISDPDHIYVGQRLVIP